MQDKLKTSSEPKYCVSAMSANEKEGLIAKPTMIIFLRAM